MTLPYAIAACQPRTQLVFDKTGAFQPGALAVNVEHYCDLIARAAADGAKLVVFPQFGLSGYRPVQISDWIKASVPLPGPQTDLIGEACKAAKVHAVVAVTEVHDAFPGRYFSSAAVIGPNGNVLLVYRKNYVLSTRTRPIDVGDAFVRQFGADSFLPVVDTPVGRIGVAIAGEVYWPEVVRSLALKGAEIIVNPTSAPPAYYNKMRPTGALTRPVRAFENQVYLAFSNCGVVIGDDGEVEGPPDGDWPPSQIYDFNGRSIGVAEPGGGRYTLATIDLEALRLARRQPSINFLAQVQPSIHADPEGLDALWPTDAFADRPITDSSQLRDIELQVLARLRAAGRIVDPSTSQD